MHSKPLKHGKGWRIRWWDAHGARQSLTIHTDYKSACLLLRQRENEAEEIRRGLRAPGVEPKSFDQLADHYLKNYSAEKRSWRTDHTNINTNLRPYFGKLKLHEIGEQNMAEYRASKRHLKPATLRKQLTLLGTMLRVAQDNNWLAKLPKIKKPKIILLDKNFRYLRTQDEITRFLCAAREEPDEMPYYLYATAIFTGLRAGELAGLNRDDINFERNLILLQRTYDGRPTKNGESRPAPLHSILRPILAEWLLKNPGKILFPNQRGGRLGESARVFQEVFHRVLDRGGFPSEVVDGKVRRYVTFHCLRHSYASHYMMRGGELWKLQKYLGHKSQQMTERYSHLGVHAFEGDLDRFGSLAPGFGKPAAMLSIGNGQPMTPSRNLAK